jgi:hypothetical protein
MALLTDEEQPFARAVLIRRVAAEWTSLGGIVRIHCDGL